MALKTRVTILDDHQSIADGYVYRLANVPQIEVVATVMYGEDLEPALVKTPTDVLLLDVSVPTSADNPNPYPILHSIQALLDRFSGLSILVISMHNERGLIRAVMEAGASGYVLKDDQSMIRDLGNVVLSVAGGGLILSHEARQLLNSQGSESLQQLLSPRQLEAISLCSSYPDLPTAELARKMSVSNSTIRNLLSGAYLRLGVHTRMAATDKARQMGLLSPLP